MGDDTPNDKNKFPPGGLKTLGPIAGKARCLLNLTNKEEKA